MLTKTILPIVLTFNLGVMAIDTAQAGNGQRPAAKAMGQGGAKQEWQLQAQQSGSGAKQQKTDKQRKQEQVTTRSKKTIREQLRNQDVYGHEMMSAAELNQYRERLKRAQNDREWAQLRETHQRDMQNRAQSRGLSIDPPIYGQHLMTTRERDRYVNRMQAAGSEVQRNQIREEHRKMIQERAGESGIYLPPAE